MSDTPQPASRPKLLPTIGHALWIEIGTFLIGVVAALHVLIVSLLLWALVAWICSLFGGTNPLTNGWGLLWVLVLTALGFIAAIIFVIGYLIQGAGERRRKGSTHNRVEAVSQDVSELLGGSFIVLTGFLSLFPQ